MSFKKNGPGCCGCDVPASIAPFADCHGGIGPGVACTIADSGGTTIFSGNTDSTGHIAGLLLTPGATYTLTISGYGSPRWAASVTFPTPVGSGTEVVTLPRAAGYVCLGGCGYPLSNRLTLDGARDSPVLLAIGADATYWPADPYRATVPTEGTYATSGGVDAYGARGSAIPGWTLDCRFDPGSGDSLQEVFSVTGTADCSTFLVTFPHTGTGGGADWTLTEAPPVP